jgi:hypothetical protein
MRENRRFNSFNKKKRWKNYASLVNIWI